MDGFEPLVKFGLVKSVWSMVQLGSVGIKLYLIIILGLIVKIILNQFGLDQNLV